MARELDELTRERKVQVGVGFSGPYVQPSSWRWTLGFETRRRHHRNL